MSTYKEALREAVQDIYGSIFDEQIECCEVEGDEQVYLSKLIFDIPEFLEYDVKYIKHHVEGSYSYGNFFEGEEVTQYWSIDCKHDYEIAEMEIFPRAYSCKLVCKICGNDEAGRYMEDSLICVRITPKGVQVEYEEDKINFVCENDYLIPEETSNDRTRTTDGV